MMILLQVGLLFLSCSAVLCSGCETLSWCESYADAVGVESMCWEPYFRLKCECTCRPEFKFTEWTSWSHCSRIDGNYKITRTRRCVEMENRADADPSKCSGGDDSQSKSCEHFWSEWSWWSACSVSCGDGEASRARTCRKRGSTARIRTQTTNCPETPEGSVQYQRCNVEPCYSWTQWRSYFKCSTTCGSEKLFLTRSCMSIEGHEAETNEYCPDPQNLGAVRTESCNLKPCSDRDWTSCSKTCGGGKRSRQQCNKDGCTTVREDCNNQDCSDSLGQEVEYVARTFLRSITAKSPPSSESHQCAQDFSTYDRSMKMYASPCSSTNTMERQAGRNQNTASKTKRDILFLIDESSSVGTTNFQRFLRLAETVVNRAFCAGETEVDRYKTRVAAATFDSRQYLQLDFKSAFDKETLLRKMRKIRFNHKNGGFTCIGDILRFATRSIFTSMRGARTNIKDTATVIVLLTDGCSHCKSLRNDTGVKQIAEKLKSLGISIVTFMVGPHTTECITEMKTMTDETRCFQLFQVDEWSQVDQVIKGLETIQCKSSWSEGCN